MKLFLESVREGVERWLGACDGELPADSIGDVICEKSRKNIREVERI